ncbi:MAG: hypothetical protein FWG98_10440 [Candidatus Cloacimonetes bacterium]|nr:hypothetical protein [Candidatus Cloacimonadota bacterium]
MLYIIYQVLMKAMCEYLNKTIFFNLVFILAIFNNILFNYSEKLVYYLLGYSQFINDIISKVPSEMGRMFSSFMAGRIKKLRHISFTCNQLTKYKKNNIFIFEKFEIRKWLVIYG